MNSAKRFVDLHVHTNFSDGTFSPREVFQYAARKDIWAVAITDHDCVDGLDESLTVSRQLDIELVPGVEITAQQNKIEIHILGLYIDWQTGWFLDKLRVLREDRQLRLRKIIGKLNNFGVDITQAEVLSLSSSKGSVGRLHLARALLEKNEVRSIKEAFDRFLGEGKPGYVARMKISPEDAINMIKSLRGIPILAHPGTMGHDELIPQLVKNGLMGIEAYHSDHNQKIINYYKKIASKYKLLISGGSDCHGNGKGYPLIGLAKVPYEILENIKAAWQKEYA